LDQRLRLFSAVLWAVCLFLGVRWRTGMLDLLYIAITLAVFAVLYLILKGVERFER
jgi:hypothetical protein